MTMLAYSALLMLGLLLSAPWWLFRMATTERYREGLGQRLGLVRRGLTEGMHGYGFQYRTVWIHAVSVGEVLAASRLVEELEKALVGKLGVVVSTTTQTGYKLARERFGTERVFYMPFDFAFAIRPYLEKLKPVALVLMESELWPRLLHECARRNIPVAVANARVSDRSFRRAMKVRGVWKHLVRKPTLWLAQSEEDARRLMALGARPESIQASGNLKYDVQVHKQTGMVELIRQVAAGRPIVVAGSTVDDRYASEEQVFLQAAMGPVWQSYPNTLLVLAPRHPERFDEVTELASAMASTVRATMLIERGSAEPIEERVIILDTIGDLAGVYSIADAAFVGGSLVPKGGHNPLEPARYAVPILMGPHFENFRDIVAQMQAADGIAIVNDEFACHEVLLNLLGRRPSDREMGERGRAVFESQQGATARTVAAILNMIEAGNESGAPRLASETWVSTEADGSAP